MTALLERIAKALERIADAEEYYIAEGLRAASADTPGCEHPEECRIHLGARMGETPYWVCHTRKGGCGFRSNGTNT